MRKSYKEDSSQIIYSTHRPVSSTIRSTPSKEIGYRTKHKIQFKAQIHTQSSLHNNPEHSLVYPQENSTLYASLAGPESKVSRPKDTA